MEIVSETDFGKPQNPFVPNFFVDISEYMEQKIDAVNLYDTELGQHPFPRSIKNIEALATVRGAAAGVEYAEAFRMIKCIICERLSRVTSAERRRECYESKE